MDAQRTGASIADDPEARQWWAKLYRYSATPGAATALARMWFETNVRNILPAIHVPTLLISSQQREEYANTASSIPGAMLLEVPSPSSDRPPRRGDQDALFSVLGRFLDSVRDERMAFDRVLATVLFTELSFEPRGEHELKGVADRWRLYRVMREPSAVRG